jgi:hypothetical protein
MLAACGVHAVTQSIPMTPIQFARLFQSTMVTAQTNRALEMVFWKNSSDNLKYPRVESIPSCSDLMKDSASFSGFLSREFREVTTSNDVTATNPSVGGTAALIRDIQESGKRRVSIAALAERPVQYTVCSGTRWNNKEVVPFIHRHLGEYGVDKGGLQYTWIAFENSCPNFTALVTVDVTEAGAFSPVKPISRHCHNMNLYSFFIC